MKQLMFCAGVVWALGLAGCQSTTNRPKLFGGNPKPAADTARTTAPANPQPVANQNQPMNGFPAPGTNSNTGIITPTAGTSTPGTGATNANFAGSDRFTTRTAPPTTGVNPMDMNNVPNSSPPNLNSSFPGGSPGFRNPSTGPVPQLNNGPVINQPAQPVGPGFRDPPTTSGGSPFITNPPISDPAPLR